jgi:hypothetical protein
MESTGNHRNEALSQEKSFEREMSGSLSMRKLIEGLLELLLALVIGVSKGLFGFS